MCAGDRIKENQWHTKKLEQQNLASCDLCARAGEWLRPAPAMAQKNYVRPKCQADLLKQKFQEEKYSDRVKTENEIQKLFFFIATPNKITVNLRRSPPSLPHF
jgi:hypothetical protein